MHNEVNRVYTYIKHQKSNSEDNLKIYIKEHVEEAYKVIQRIYNDNKTQPKNIILEKIKHALRDVRFDKTRYFFIYSLEGHSILHPILPHLEGKDLINYQDAKGTYLLKEMKKILSKDESTFYDWYWYKPNDKQNQYKKTGYFKKFEPLNLFIGTGEYLDDFEKRIQDDILSYTPKIHFQQKGFIFILNEKGEMLSNPNQALIGKNVYKAQDKEGQYFVQNMIQVAKNEGSGYITYLAPTLSMDSQHKKTSYIKGFQDWNWVIGAGFYQQEIDKVIQTKKMELKKSNHIYLISMLLISFVSTLLLLALSILLSKNIKRKFLDYKKRLLLESQKNREKDILLSQQSKMAAMGEMLANIAHQWRQPLSLISTSSSALKVKHQLGILEEEDIIATTQNISNHTQYLSNTLDNFRNFFKPDQQKKEFSLYQSLDRVLEIVSDHINSSNIKIIKDISHFNIKTTENDFMQIIINILNNAKDALIASEVKNKLIFITIHTENNHAIITIKDNAGGIPEKIVDRIYEPYFTTKHQSQGTGIGLYMTKEIIIKHMKGEITNENVTFTYHNTTYTGAQFRVKLPL